MKIKLIIVIIYITFVTPAFSENRRLWKGPYNRVLTEYRRAGAGEKPSSALGPGDYDFSLEHDGLVRTYKVHVPPSYNSRNPAPVVLNFHGGYGNAEAAERQTEMAKTSDKEGFILVYPEAVIGAVSPQGKRYQHWNGGPRSESDKSQEIDDVGFISALIDKLEKDFSIDSERIYATGISNGGTMVYRLACQLSDRIAAVAPVEANQLDIKCNPDRTVPIMHFHGLADKFVPYNGGVSPELPDVWKTVETTISEWKERNGCSVSSRVTYEKDGASCVTYGPCKENAEVVLCRIKNHGHTWPGGPDNGDGAKICQSNPNGLLCNKFREYFGPVSQDISANDAMWEFFKKHPKSSGVSIYRPGDHSFVLSHGGLERRYLAHIPSSYDGKTKMAVVIAFHGGGANPELIDKEFGGMNAKADKEGFIAVYPSGHKCIDVPGKNMYCWNADSLFGLEFVNYKVDDVDFISAMIEKLSQDFLIDEKRVYATGASNGAWMAYAAACRLSHKIAAIAPIAGGLAMENCAPSNPVSIMHFHGTADPGWPYYGGGSCWTDSIRPPISETLLKWRDINQCSAPRPAYQNGDASCETSACNNSEITSCTIKGGGHTVPGGYSFPIEKLMPWDEDCALGRAGRGVGKVSNDIIALDAMWEFFKKHPRTGALEEASSALGQGDHDFSLEHDGLVRTYKVHVPAQYDKNTPVPVVIYIHGGGGNARSAYLDKMDLASDKLGFILAVPEAVGEIKLGELRGSWNGGAWATGECCGSADDVGFISKMIDEIKGKFKVDERRIYATGISNGGLMTNRLGCELSDKIAAIATVAPAAIPSDCKPQRPLPVMDIHGTADTCNPFDGGEPLNAICRKVDYKRMPPGQVVGRWLDINGCLKEPDVSAQNSKVTYSTYAECKSEAEVVFVKVKGMGHAWPSGFESKLLGVSPVSYDISFDQIWEFFQEHPRAGAAEEVSSTLGPGDHDFSFEHDGYTRKYRVHVPSLYDRSKSTAAILVLHGGGGSMEAMNEVTLMDSASDKYSFLAVYPQGIGNEQNGKMLGTWNAGKCCGKAMQEDVDDVGFISKIIERIGEDFNVDKNRIYATGHSNGAQMSYRLACELSEKIAAIAPVGGQGVLDSCKPKRRVPILHIHGTDDLCAKYNGGTTGGCFQEYINDLLGLNITPYTWQAKSIPDYIDEWKKINNAQGGSEITYSKGNAACETWGKGTNSEVVLCTVLGMGHTWPGGRYGAVCNNPDTRACKLWKKYVGELSSDINANEAMWEFFKKHPFETETP